MEYRPVIPPGRPIDIVKPAPGTRPVPAYYNVSGELPPEPQPVAVPLDYVSRKMCPICGKMFSKYTCVQGHIKIVHEQKRFKKTGKKLPE